MRKFLSVLAFCLVSAFSYGQVQFTKFKFAKDEPFGNFPGRKMITTKFTNTSGKSLKYVFVQYYAVNGVGDVISGVNSGIKSDDEEFIKPKELQMTGPFEAGKKYSQWASGVIFSQRKDVTAFPYKIQIVYMGENEVHDIMITKDNINTYFPCVKWMEINRYSKVL